MELYKGAKTVFQDVSMNLREWVINSESVNNKIPKNGRGDIDNLNVLGHIWKTKSDEIILNRRGTIDKSKVLTKRTLLQHLASVHDPLGLFAPVILKGKMFKQALWRKNFDWDDELSESDKLHWGNRSRIG